jgi:thioredoxin reductase (NADPH)
MTSQSYDVVVIGAGASGLCAAAHCAERGATVACVEQAPLPGGLIANVGAIDGFPAAGELSGAALVDGLTRRCADLGVAMVQAEVSALEDAGGWKRLATPEGPVQARLVVLASGARLRRLGVPGESELAGRGVSQCDWCDGGFFRGEPVVVVGGGDAAFQAALHLAQLCASVTVVMRSATMRARRAYVQAAAENERIAFLWDTTVERINGRDKVESVTLRDHAEGMVSDHPTAGVFVFAGVEPQAGFLPPEVTRDAAGCVVTDADFRTSVPGVFAIGAVRSGYRGPLVSACGEGAAVAAVVAQALEALQEAA